MHGSYTFLFCFIANIAEGARSGSGGSSWSSGSSGGGGGGYDPRRWYGDECDFYATYEFKVRNGSSYVLLDDDDISIWEDKNITGVTNITSANADRYLPSDAEIQNINWQMDVYDAYYNGTVIMTLTPDPNNANTSACATITSQTIEDAYLRIGPRSRDGVDRGIYDSNDLYLAIGRSLAQYKCPYTPNALFFAVESSSSLTYHGTIWDLNATKTANGDGFDIQGSVNSRQAAYNNHYNYVMNTTDPGYGATSNNVTCPDWFIKQALTSLHSPTLSGSVTDESGQVTWSFNDIYFGYKVSATFEGKAWDKGAKLDTSGDVVATTGQAKRVKWRSDEPSTAEKYKWVIVGCVIGGIIIIGWCVWKCCGVCSSKKKPAKQPETYVLQGQTWQRH